MRKPQINVGDRVEIAKGHYWPHSKYGTVIRKDVPSWFIVLQDYGNIYPNVKPVPQLFSRAQLTKL